MTVTFQTTKLVNYLIENTHETLYKLNENPNFCDRLTVQENAMKSLYERSPTLVWQCSKFYVKNNKNYTNQNQKKTKTNKSQIKNTR